MSQVCMFHGRAIDPTAADHGGARGAPPPFSNTSVRDFHDPFTLDYLTKKLIHLPLRDRQKLASPARLASRAACLEERQTRPARRPHLRQSISEVRANPTRRKRLENRRNLARQTRPLGNPQRQIPATRPQRRIPRHRHQLPPWLMGVLDYRLTRMMLFFSSRSRFVGVTGFSESAKAMMATRSPALMRWAAPPLIMM